MTLYLVFHQSQPGSSFHSTKFRDGTNARWFRDKCKKEGLLAEVNTLTVDSFKGHKLADKGSYCLYPL